MDSLIDPVADVVWNAVATVVTAAGTEERAPQTPEEWLTIRRSAVTLIEASNLLQIPGRLVARPGEKSENPNIELEPEEIMERIERDRTTWIERAHAMHDAASEVLRAIDARNVQGLLDAGEKLDLACESCHLKYWYPNQRIPALPSHRDTVGSAPR
jgi:hypothetical protein